MAPTLERFAAAVVASGLMSVSAAPFHATLAEFRI